jgi:predicted transcriptional regulator
MTSDVVLKVGGSPEDDLAAFSSAWKAAEAGAVAEERIIAFESWEALARVLTNERYRLLKHLRRSPARSVNALALALERQYRRVHEDVVALEKAGLVVRSDGEVRAAVARITAEIRL